MAEPKNIYSLNFYSGENKGKLKVARRQNHYRTNVWITRNQTMNAGKGNYCFYGITINEGAEPTEITKWDKVEGQEPVEIKTQLYNLDQTNFAEVHPDTYEYLRMLDKSKPKNKKRYVPMASANSRIYARMESVI